MKAITLRNIPSELARIIEKKARKENTSISRTIIHLLEESLETRKRKRKIRFHDLDTLKGSWSKEETDSFKESLENQRRIDPELWG